MHDAYSHEVSSAGYWPGGSDEGSFYSYAYAEPAGFADQPVQPDAAYYDPALGEFILPVPRRAQRQPTPMRRCWRSCNRRTRRGDDGRLGPPALEAEEAAR